MHLGPILKGKLVAFLRGNAGIFAREHVDTPGIPREVAEHRFNMDEAIKLMEKKLRRFNLK